jgi:uncharacterized repeat protein (TIGR03803 family)
LGSLVQGLDGNFYGTTEESSVFKITPSGTVTMLYKFSCIPNCTDGASPFGGLVEGTDGNFYGTTFEGGANTNCNSGYGCGTIFKITPKGTLTTLYSFCAQANCADGDSPIAGLVQGLGGDFFGTTQVGGANGD